LAAVFWSVGLDRVVSLTGGGENCQVLTVQFHMLLWAAAAMFLLLFLSGRLGELSVFRRRETSFLLLAATGGYGFHYLCGIALGSGAPSVVMSYLYAAPLMILALSLLTREKALGRQAIAVALGFVGCVIVIVKGRVASGPLAVADGAGRMAALGSAACWAVFSAIARPIAREEKTLPVAALVTVVGAACLLVTCVSQGVAVFRLSLGQFVSAALAGGLAVCASTALWLRCLGMLPAVSAAPLWYLGAVFGLVWARGEVSVWWALLGTVLILLSLHASGDQRPPTRDRTFGDVIRG
jgi:drug/metabolite transporter (DMT)-like permease